MNELGKIDPENYLEQHTRLISLFKKKWLIGSMRGRCQVMANALRGHMRSCTFQPYRCDKKFKPGKVKTSLCQLRWSAFRWQKVMICYRVSTSDANNHKAFQANRNRELHMLEYINVWVFFYLVMVALNSLEIEGNEERYISSPIWSCAA